MTEAAHPQETETRSTLRSRLESREAEIARLRQELGLITRIQDAVIDPPKWSLKPKANGVKHAIAGLQLTDTHFDEVVRPEEVDYINAYNRQIAEKRLRRWVEKGIILARNYVSGVQIDGVMVFATGDILSGDIHDELKQTNADHLYSSAYHWIGQLHAAIDALADEFGKVHVAAVVGNHGRSTKKPVFKGRARSNIEWLVWSVLAREFASDDRVTIQVSDSMDANVQVYDTRFVLTHGDQFKGGSGISGILTPLSLGTYRKGLRNAVTDHPMDMLVMGHFHQYLQLPGVMVGGSMKGYDEYAYGHNLRPETAQQSFFIITPEHGITMHAPIIVQKRENEGW